MYEYFIIFIQLNTDYTYSTTAFSIIVIAPMTAILMLNKWTF